MTKTRSTKRALLMSALSLLLCISMLIGSTFAWFTDSVSSNNNIIKSGNLDVELEYLNDGSWEKVTATTNVFEKDTLWEPGHTEVVYLKVSNLGSLALKYNLGVNIVNEIGSINVKGAAFRLSDYIKFGVKEGVETPYADRAAARAAINDADAVKLSTGYTKAGSIVAGDPAQYVALVVYMPETVGNEANYKTGEDAPKIDLGINLMATQFTYEEDSFNNQYDANAPFSLWDGKVPAEMPETLVVDGDNQIVHVKDAAAFAYLSTLSNDWVALYTDGNGRDYTNYAKGAGANYYYSGKWTVSLEADIDLNNHAINPVNIFFGEGTGHTAFKGNNHIIRNINTTTGLFEASTRAIFSDLTLENVKATNGALSATATASISNVTVKNAKISGVDYVGGLVGRAFGNVTGCKVIDSVVIASGKEAGGLIGYAETNHNTTTIASNTVKNVSVYANNRAAGLIAQPNVNIKVHSNTIDNVTVGATDTSKYLSDAVASNALAPENVYNNTVNNCTVDNGNTAEIVDDAAGLKDALNNGTDIIYADGVVVEGTTQLNTGATVVGATFKNENGTAVTQTVSGTFKDCVFEGSEALRWCYSNAGDTVVFENCVIKTDFRGVHFDNMKGDVIFKNCEINGFNAIGGAGTVTFENCTFGNDKSNYNGLNMYSNINLIDCTFNYVSGKTNFIDMEGSGKTLTITNCKATLDGVETPISTFVGGSKLAQNTVIYN